MAQSVTHRLTVELRPDSGEMIVEDTISTPEAVPQFEFVLNAGLEVEAQDARLETLNRSSDGLRVAYRATPERRSAILTLRYHGRPQFAGVRTHGGMPQGELGRKGVYLDASSAWYPLFDAPVGGMDLDVTVPDGWQSISVGARSEHAEIQRWTTDQPHDSLYLIAGPYQRYARKHGDIDLSVWLLGDDAALAERYLAVMGDYIDHYSRLIGTYPYRKFAVVENRYQTGFGMPSFTLLGSRVMRLPFIPFTSLPHEILHNWWGNGVWIDYRRGNWSEGLTAYLADHWMQERQGKGDQYRLKALQRYSNFAADGDDRPLRQFVSRHNDASQSIGYSKSLMLFHMLREELGDAAFVAGLQRLWRDHRFSAIGFEQAVRALTADHPELADRASALLDRKGAPRLELGETRVTSDDAGYRLTFELRQAAPAFDLRVPIGIVVDGQAEAELRHVRLDALKQEFTITTAARPLRLDVDPGYDLLRYLDVSEQPPALNRLFGGTAWLVLPRHAKPADATAWEQLAMQWRKRYPALKQTWDDQVASVPGDADLLILGWDNALRPRYAEALARTDQSLTDNGAVIGDAPLDRDSHSLVLLNSDAAGRTIALLDSPTPAGIQALARKLPHYGSYGRLAFDAAAARNLRKDSLTSDHSKLIRQLGDEPVAMRLPRRQVLGGE
ncbi:MAG: M1 family aminopeptidase [Chromatiaceae bacterium]|jgi:hypothetical protein